MNKEQIFNVSVSLQQVIGVLDEHFAELAGERLAFMLVVSMQGAVQYASNGDRQECMKLLEELLARWKAGRADIPAHINPDLNT